MFRKYILPWLVLGVYRAWSLTWRLRRHESPALIERLNKGQPVVIAIWHGDEMGMVRFSRFYRLATMTSYSKDGTLMDFVLRRHGMATARGSSSRGGAQALRGMIRLTRQGYSPVVAVDGPKGPVHKAKPGVLELARVTGLPVFPCAMASSRHIPLRRSWNRACLPLPFARVLVYWGQPITVDRHDNARSPQMAQQVEDAINDCRRKAGESLLHPDR